MFEQIPFTGYLICYGPLALIIGGFIFFAAKTDKHARRTYLRNLDPRPTKERSTERRLPADREMRVATPSGLPVMVKPDKEAVAEAVPPSTAAEARAETMAIQTEPDDLKKIEGVGPKMSSVLQEAGLTTFAAVAARTGEELRQILDDAGVSAIIDPSTWPEQAQLAAASEWDELEQLQDDLKGGRRS